jgi:hypothetical protein
LLLGLFGWDRRRLALFAAAALSALVPLYALSAAKLLAGSIRFLIPIYPLYAVFTALGLAKSTEGFRGRAGTAAAFWLSVLAIGFPAQFFSTLVDAKIALRRISVEQGLYLSLPAYPLWKRVHPEDRVLLLGEWDRYHCPAGFVIRDLDANQGKQPEQLVVRDPPPRHHENRLSIRRAKGAAHSRPFFRLPRAHRPKRNRQIVSRAGEPRMPGPGYLGRLGAIISDLV